jgi:hypothetical protein
LGKRALFGVIARLEEGNDASRWAAPRSWLLRAWRRGCPGRAARLGGEQAASAGPRSAAPEWGEGSGCWVGLGFQPGFGPQPL